MIRQTVPYGNNAVSKIIWPSWCHCHSLSLASAKSRLVLPFWYQLTRVVPEKGPLNGCVCVGRCSSTLQHAESLIHGAGDYRRRLCWGSSPCCRSRPWSDRRRWLCPCCELWLHAARTHLSVSSRPPTTSLCNTDKSDRLKLGVIIARLNYLKFYSPTKGWRRDGGGDQVAVAATCTSRRAKSNSACGP